MAGARPHIDLGLHRAHRQAAGENGTVSEVVPVSVGGHGLARSISGPAHEVHHRQAEAEVRQDCCP